MIHIDKSEIDNHYHKCVLVCVLCLSIFKKL